MTNPVAEEVKMSSDEWLDSVLTELCKEMGSHRHSAATNEETLKMYIGSDHYNWQKQAILAHLSQAERAARIDEVNKMPSPAYIGADGIRLELIAEYKNHRLAELNPTQKGDEGNEYDNSKR